MRGGRWSGSIPPCSGVFCRPYPVLCQTRGLGPGGRSGLAQGGLCSNVKVKRFPPHIEIGRNGGRDRPLRQARYSIESQPATSVIHRQPPSTTVNHRQPPHFRLRTAVRSLHCPGAQPIMVPGRPHDRLNSCWHMADGGDTASDPIPD
jgi:hypothetical protein